MYTERYMKTYEQNPEGYNETAVRNATGFKNARGGFAVMHGTGDDNVHYQNSAALIDLLVREGDSPQKMEMMAFTDSDHLITFHGASAWLYNKYLTKRLWEEKERKVGMVEQTHQWLGKRKVAVWDM